MKRSIKEIVPIETSQKAGMKRVLLSAEESGCSITQIAITELKSDEVVKAHVHKDMQEGFYVMNGDLDLVLDDVVEHCHPEDFMYVSAV